MAFLSAACMENGSRYNDRCAAIFMEATPTRSVVIFADQCTMCRGLHDGLQGLDRTEVSEPEDCGYHALPQGAEYWTKDNDIVPPPIKEGFDGKDRLLSMANCAFQMAKRQQTQPRLLSLHQKWPQS